MEGAGDVLNVGVKGLKLTLKPSSVSHEILALVIAEDQPLIGAQAHQPNCQYRGGHQPHGGYHSGGEGDDPGGRVCEGVHYPQDMEVGPLMDRRWLNGT